MEPEGAKPSRWGLALSIVVAALAVLTIVLPNLLGWKVGHWEGDGRIISALRAYDGAQRVFMKGRYSLKAHRGEFASFEDDVFPPPEPEAYDAEKPMYAHPFFDLHRLARDETKTEPGEWLHESVARAHTPERPYQGYWFTAGMVQAPHAEKFDLMATPVDYGVTGTLTYYIDQQGTVRQRDLGRTLTPDDFPLKEDFFNDPSWIDS